MKAAERALFPFSAIVEQETMKLALVLNAIDPLIGGVLISGTRGTAKSTAVRALAEVLPPPTPFVDLPVGATEDRVLGTLNIEKALQHGEKHFEPGLLAQAHGGILYIDEVNLLPDHLFTTQSSIAEYNSLESDCCDQIRSKSIRRLISRTDTPPYMPLCSPDRLETYGPSRWTGLFETQLLWQ